MKKLCHQTHTLGLNLQKSGAVFAPAAHLILKPEATAQVFVVNVLFDINKDQ